ncbi:MAG: TOBE domain-containing protein, partial [Dehalococcoidia bacterium]|nr:TOBE domain-containing protein [Dehalococcoidia bacterium]
ELEINAAKGTEDRGVIIELREFEGEFSEYKIRLDSGALIRVRRRAAEGLSKGQRVVVQTRNNLPLIVFPNVPGASEI